MWKVHAINIFLVAFSLLVNLLRGSPKTQSIIGISKCGVVDFTLLLGFIMFNLVVTSMAVISGQRRQHLKEKFNKGIVSGVVKYEGWALTKLKLGSFFGGIVGAFGLGGGVVFNPLLLSLGVLP